MKKIIIPLVLILSCITVSVASEKPLGVEEFTSVDELAQAIAAYFPKVQGEVKAVQADHLTVGLGKKDGLTPNMTLTLWRDGKELLHPVTGAVIGRVEEEVGTVEVTSVGDASSVAVVKKKLKDPKAGDKARITPKKISLAVVPLRADKPELSQQLADRLNELGRFQAIESDKVASFLKDKKRKDDALVKEMGAFFNIDAIVALGVYPVEGKLLVTAKIVYAEDARQLDTIVAMLSLTSKREALGDVRPFFEPVKTTTEASPDLPFAARYLAVADFDGDGVLEYVFSDQARLHIYRLEPSGWHEVWTETVPAAEREIQHLSIDAADINGNKRPEIFVTAMLNGKVFSYVVEAQGGSYQRIGELPGFLRLVNYPGLGLALIGQEYDPKSFFAGTPKQYVWSSGKYVPGQELPLPKGMGIYGFALAEFGEPRPLLIAFDDKDQLVVYSRETPIWKSEERYAQVGTFVLKPATGIDAVMVKPAAELDKGLRVRLPGRMIALDINADGKDEVLVPRNIGGAFFGDFSEAEMDGMGWNGARLEQIWSTKGIPGPVLDFSLVRREKGAAQIYTLVKLPGGLFSKDKVRVITYSVK